CERQSKLTRPDLDGTSSSIFDERKGSQLVSRPPLDRAHRTARSHSCYDAVHANPSALLLPRVVRCLRASRETCDPDRLPKEGRPAHRSLAVLGAARITHCSSTMREPGPRSDPLGIYPPFYRCHGPAQCSARVS